MPRVSSFAPEFLALFRHAADEPVEISNLTFAASHTLASRLHRCRNAMRAEQHPLAPVADRVTVSRRKDQPDLDDRESTWTVVARPPDMDFAKAIRSAGVNVNDALDVADDTPAPPLEEPELDANATVQAVHDFLNQKQED